MLQDNYLICVFGSGLWGSALATQINNKFGSCRIFTKTQSTFDSINQQHTNKGFFLSKNIKAEIDLGKLNRYKNIIISSPSYGIDQVIKDLQSINIDHKINLIISTKGLDTKKEQLFSTTFEESFKNQIMVLSGPSFADEVINNMLTAVNLAAKDFGLASQISDLISNNIFIAVPSTDLVGLQLSGVMKNILAMLVGMLSGLNYGENMKSAIIAKGIQEMKHISYCLGGIKKESLSSDLAMTGDAVLTSLSNKSRNMSFGQNLVTKTENSMDKLVEGRLAISTLQKIAKKNNIDLKVMDLAAKSLEAALNKDYDKLKEIVNSSFAQVVSSF